MIQDQSAEMIKKSQYATIEDQKRPHMISTLDGLLSDQESMTSIDKLEKGNVTIDTTAQPTKRAPLTQGALAPALKKKVSPVFKPGPHFVWAGQKRYIPKKSNEQSRYKRDDHL